MNDKRYKWILYTIVIVIVATIGIQIYWNYKNYQTNKQQLINDVQVSLDKAVDDYYANLAQKTTFGMSFEGVRTDKLFEEGSRFTTILKDIDEKNGTFKNLDSLDVSHIEGATIVRGFQVDSMMESHNKKHQPISIDSFKTKINELKDVKNDLELSNIEMLTSKIIISINNDSLNLKEVDSLVKLEFERKKIFIDYKLHFNEGKNIGKFSLNFHKTDSSTTKKLNSGLSTTSKSTFLPKQSTLLINFSNETRTILKRILGGIFISTLLVLAVIFCLFYLLNIIKNQKQLAEVKNDLISNITHEFKTPIATIGVAIESIKNFNVINDKEKTRTYLDMSNDQLSKLNVMVEKLLETATLDSDNLKLEKDEYNISDVLNTIVEKHQMQTEKTVNFTSISKDVLANVDMFHFENAVNNILDNAIKYGGNNINIDLNQNSFASTISISDDGNTLTKANKDKIFEKFYRIPKGNTHDVKGFGIGLYYAKKITEKHGGSIHLDLNNKQTTFKISFPNE